MVGLVGERECMRNTASQRIGNWLVVISLTGKNPKMSWTSVVFPEHLQDGWAGGNTDWSAKFGTDSIHMMERECTAPTEMLENWRVGELIIC